MLNLCYAIGCMEVGLASIYMPRCAERRQISGCQCRLPLCMMSLMFAPVGETQDGYYQPLEKAEMVRTGGDVTILCYSRMRYVVMQAVGQLEKEGYDPEVRICRF